MLMKTEVSTSSSDQQRFLLCFVSVRIESLILCFCTFKYLVASSHNVILNVGIFIYSCVIKYTTHPARINQCIGGFVIHWLGFAKVKTFNTDIFRNPWIRLF